MFNNVIQKILLASLILASNVALADLSNAPSGKYALDKGHGYITASYSHLGFSNPAIGFTDFEVDLELNAADPSKSKLNVTVNANSVDSRVAVFNDHLKGEHFFDTSNHPEITFTASAIESKGGNNYSVTGELSMKGVTKTVSLDTTINKVDVHPMRKVPTIGVDATTILTRSEWNMGRGAPAVSDDVTLTISVELPQQVPGGGMGGGMGMGMGM